MLMDLGSITIRLSQSCTGEVKTDVNEHCLLLFRCTIVYFSIAEEREGPRVTHASASGGSFGDPVCNFCSEISHTLCGIFRETLSWIFCLKAKGGCILKQNC